MKGRPIQKTGRCAGKPYRKSQKAYAIDYKVSLPTVKRWWAKGLPCDDPDAMGEHVSPRGRKPTESDDDFDSPSIVSFAEPAEPAAATEVEPDAEPDAPVQLVESFYQGRGFLAEIERLQDAAQERRGAYFSAIRNRRGTLNVRNRLAEWMSVLEALRKVEKDLPGTRQALPRWTRQQINRKVDWLYQNFGVVKEGVRGITRHTNGKGRFLQLNTDDPDWNELAEMDWETYAASKDRCDLAGRRNLYDFQNLAMEQRLKKGEYFGAFVQNPRWKATRANGSLLLDAEGAEVGDPCMMAFDADEIQTPAGKGPGDRIFDGIELDENNATAFIHALVAGGATQAIPASEAIHWYKPDEPHQLRGVSEFAQGVGRLVDIHDLIKVTTKSGKAHGAMALLVKKAAKVGGQGAFGAIRNSGRNSPAPPPAEGQQVQGGATQVGGQPLEQVFGGGAIMYVTEDGDVKVVNSTQPSPLVEPFVTDLLMRDTCAGWGVSGDFFWSMAKLNGANIRAVLLKAELLFTVLGDGLDTELNIPWAIRYLLHRVATGKLRPCKDPNWLSKVSFQGPARLSVDEGRTGMLEIQQLANGITTMQIADDSRGRSWRPKVKQWFREWAYAERCAKDERVPWALQFWRAAQPGAAGGPGDKGKPDDGKEPEEDDPEPGGDDKPAKP